MKIAKTIEVKLKMARDIASSLAYMHEMDIIHRDMKAENLLVDSEMNICIADLGISRVRSNRMTKGMGTPRYMAPELLEGREYSEKADVYSFAILFWEILSEKLPFGEDCGTSWEVAEVVGKGGRPPFDPEWPTKVTSLIERCWAQEPVKRPSMSFVVHLLESFCSMTREKLFAVAREVSLKRVSTLDQTPAKMIFKEAASIARNRQLQNLPKPPALPDDVDPVVAQTSPAPIRRAHSRVVSISTQSGRMISRLAQHKAPSFPLSPPKGENFLPPSRQDSFPLPVSSPPTEESTPLVVPSSLKLSDTKVIPIPDETPRFGNDLLSPKSI